MARDSGLSPSTVQRLWAANDPQFATRFWDIVGRYLDPPTQALVLCCDEKSQCQALERTQPGLPLGQGHIVTRTHDYYRHGTLTLFAALNYLQEWLKFMQAIQTATPPGRDVSLILDNYATHKHPKVLRWLAQRPHFG